MTKVVAQMHEASSIVEDNAAGKAFEEVTCRNIRNLLRPYKSVKAFTMQELFSKLDADSIPGRVEDYSDICIRDMKTGKNVFVECKEEFGANVANMKFKLLEDGSIQFVYGKSQKSISNSLTSKLAADLMQQERFKAFIQFMHQPCKHLDGKAPVDYYFGKERPTQAIARKLAIKVNSHRKLFNTTAKRIPLGKFAATTLSSWIIALCWKLSDLNQTHIYDICSVDIDYMADLVLRHYDFQKKFPASYAQIEDNLYLFHSGKNPLKLVCKDGHAPTALPHINGRYTLKFTPRLSSPDNLKMYLDARSYFIEELPPSNCSFNGESSRIPTVNLRFECDLSK